MCLNTSYAKAKKGQRVESSLCTVRRSQYILIATKIPQSHLASGTTGETKSEFNGDSGTSRCEHQAGQQGVRPLHGRHHRHDQEQRRRPRPRQEQA